MRADVDADVGGRRSRRLRAGERGFLEKRAGDRGFERRVRRARRSLRGAASATFTVPVPGDGDGGLAVVAPDGVPGRAESRFEDAGYARWYGVSAGEEG